jgi:hypothetical protein
MIHQRSSKCYDGLLKLVKREQRNVVFSLTLSKNYIGVYNIAFTITEYNESVQTI